MEEKGLQDDPRYAQLMAVANRQKQGGPGGSGSPMPPGSGPNPGMDMGGDQGTKISYIF